MPTITVQIKNPSISGVNVVTQVTAAFAAASYPIKVRVSNLSDLKDAFPVVEGVAIPPHDNNTNDYTASKKINLSSAADMVNLATNIGRIAAKSADTDVQFVIEEIAIGSTVDTWAANWKQGVEWYGAGLTLANRPSAVAFGPGALQIGTATYVSDGINWSSKAYSIVANVSDLATVSTDNTTVFVQNNTVGGVFSHSATGVVDGGITFAGSTGFWVRQITGNIIDAKCFGAKCDGITDDSAALLSAATSLNSIKGYVLEISGTMLISSAYYLMLGGISIQFAPGASMNITSVSLGIFVVSDGFQLLPGWTINVATNYPSATGMGSLQAIFTTHNFSVVTPVFPCNNAYFGKGTLTCTLGVSDGTYRGGRFIYGFFRQSVFENMTITGMRQNIYSFGDDISGITVRGCKFYNTERGVTLSGLDGEVGNPLISYTFDLIDNHLINTATQQANYGIVQGADLYNILNVGSVTISGGSSNYACERGAYLVCNENVEIIGLKCTGTTLLKATGMQYDLSGTGGPVVNRLIKNINLIDCICNETQASFSSVYCDFISGLTVRNNNFTNSSATANSAIYIESYADGVTIQGNKAVNYLRGMVSLRSYDGLPAIGVTLARAWGTYTAGFWNFKIEDNAGDNVCQLGADSSYTPARPINFIYTLEEDTLVTKLIAASKNDLYKNILLKNNKVNKNTAFSGDRLFAPTAATRGLININFCNRIDIIDNQLGNYGGTGILGIAIGSLSRDVTVKHECGQITDYSTVPAVRSYLYTNAMTSIRFVDTQLFGSSFVNYEYTLTPAVTSGAFSPSTAREQNQDCANNYKVTVKASVYLAIGGVVMLSSPCSGTTRDYLTGVLDATLCTTAHVFGRIDADNGEYADFFINSPWTGVSLKSNSAGWAAAFTLDMITTTVTKALRLTNLTGTVARLESTHTFIVKRTGVF